MALLEFELQFLLSSTVLALLCYSFISHSLKTRNERSKGYGKLAHRWQWDPILGLDLVYSHLMSFRKNTYLDWLDNVHRNMPKTFALNFFGGRQIYTIDAENLKAMANNIADFQVSPIRYNSQATAPFADKGVIVTDGHEWELSRALVKPFFMREWYANVTRIQPFADHLFEMIPKDGETFDMFELIKKWSFDLNTQFLFGETADTMTDPENLKVMDAFMTLLINARLRLSLYRFLWLSKWSSWYDSVGIIHGYVNKHIERARREIQDRERRLKNGEEVGEERQDVCYHMVKSLPDDNEVRSHLSLLFVPNNETTTLFLSNCVWHLARNAEAWNKLREEVKDKPLTFESLREMKYLQNILQESHRASPVGLMVARAAARDTSLPRGGGPNEDLPIFVRKGDIVHITKSVMYKDPDFWGADADKFRPERFEKLRAGMHLTPYNAGPRRCPGEMMTMTESGYMLARLAQTYTTLESRDPEPYIPVVRIGLSNKNGTKVAVYK